jgi:hypothetical protein
MVQEKQPAESVEQQSATHAGSIAMRSIVSLDPWDPKRKAPSILTGKGDWGRKKRANLLSKTTKYYKAFYVCGLEIVMERG